jgi:electron transfer flavoprotein beta subunit
VNIVVCIKQVPDTAEVKINPETGTLIREGVPSIVNPFDMHAIEAGLQIKEKVGGKVTVLTMGPPQAETALREAISMGAADIIVCGKQAIDGDTAQVGPEVAEFLNIPHVSYVRRIEEITQNSIRIQRLMEEGYDVVESTLPVLLTVVKELNEPRLPSLRGKMTAKKAEIKKWNISDIQADENKLGLKGSPTQVKNIFAPEAKKDRRMLEGKPEEQVDALIQELRRLKCL